MHLNSPCVWSHICQCRIQNRGNLWCIHWAGTSRVWRADVYHCLVCSCALALSLFSARTKPLRERPDLWTGRLLLYSETGAEFPELVQVKVLDQSLWLVKSVPCLPSASLSPQILEGAGMVVAGPLFLFGKLPQSPNFFYFQMPDFFLHERESTSARIKSVTQKTYSPKTKTGIYILKFVIGNSK